MGHISINVQIFREGNDWTLKLFLLKQMKQDLLLFCSSLSVYTHAHTHKIFVVCVAIFTVDSLHFADGIGALCVLISNRLQQ